MWYNARSTKIKINKENNNIEISGSISLPYEI